MIFSRLRGILKTDKKQMSEDRGSNIVSLADVIRGKDTDPHKDIHSFFKYVMDQPHMKTSTKCIILLEDDNGNGMFHRHNISDSELLWYAEVLRHKATEDWK